MRLDVVVPTFNRSDLLRLTIQSLLAAPVPAGLEVAIYIADNNSTDDTQALVESFQVNAPIPLHYVKEKVKGSSAARNAGITAGTGDLVGFIDDDEQIDPEWYRVIALEFQDPKIQYIGGPYLLSRQVQSPDWLPPGYHAALGVNPPKPRNFFGPNHPGMLSSGNAVLRREVFDKVGLFSLRLGRSAQHLLSEEDADLYRRLQAAGLKGVYVPELIILHHVHQQRLTRKYHRQWAYWRGVSQGVLDRDVQEPVAYSFGVPRYRIGQAIRGLLRMPLDRFRKNGKGVAFAHELAIWGLIGFAYGKHFFAEKRHYDVSSPETAAQRSHT